MRSNAAVSAFLVGVDFFHSFNEEKKNKSSLSSPTKSWTDLDRTNECI